MTERPGKGRQRVVPSPVRKDRHDEAPTSWACDTAAHLHEQSTDQSVSCKAGIDATFATPHTRDAPTRIYPTMKLKCRALQVEALKHRRQPKPLPERGHQAAIWCWVKESSRQRDTTRQARKRPTPTGPTASRPTLTEFRRPRNLATQCDARASRNRE